MKKLIFFILILGLAVGGYFYREPLKEVADQLMAKFSTEEKIPRQATKIPRELPPKEVMIFDLNSEKIELSIKKSATVSSSSTVYVSPQIAGKITNILVNVGDEVRTNETLLTLGDSLGTDIADVQYQSAVSGYNIAVESYNLSQISAQNTVNGAKIGAETAQAAYQNALNNIENTTELFDEQLENAEDSLDKAEDAYDDIKDQYNDLQDDIDDLEDQYNALLSNPNATPEAIASLKQALAQAETQLATLENAKDSAKNAVEQAENGIEQLELSNEAQLDQLDFAAEAALLQYKAAVNQYKAALVGTEQQQLASEGQLVQADSAVESSALNSAAKIIKSPISGKITSITAEKGNFAAPGQVLVTVENSEALTIKTSINTEEALLINEKTPVEIEISGEKISGKIISISPTPDQISKKIKVEIEIEEEKLNSQSGFATVNFKIVPQKRIFVPLNSIIISEGIKEIKIVDDQKRVKCVEVTLGQIIGSFVEITSGLNGDEKIIDAQTVYIEEGDKVSY